MQKEQETTESSDEKTNYLLHKFKIEITIEPESPDTDSITVDKAAEINNDSNNLSDEEQNEGLNAENSLINDCEIDTSLRCVISYNEEKNNKKIQRP
ncbi:unnamed protein product [Parnassius apollo]|uniref:(apollo) hypothetical protein n=1 Tax=Parnassius apollo TaxID=110799 RepID=A0A8S3WUE1_PARAO|nr:unnamed protein product [Parnassius apollo]